MSGGFRFRQFSVCDDRCAMRVGTDGILLGAWVDTHNATRILDIGTGCGLIALMMAQRNSTALIDAIEIDAEAAQQAIENVAASPWSGRITVFHNSLQDFVNQTENASRYDLVACNPPFFSNSTLSFDDKRSTARHEERLTLTQLFSSVKTLLRDAGRFDLIVPFNRFDEIVELSKLHSLPMTIITEVAPFTGKPPNRLLLEFGQGNQSLPITSQLEIYQHAGTYSDEYWDMTQRFYLRETSAAPRTKSGYDREYS